MASEWAVVALALAVAVAGQVLGVVYGAVAASAVLLAGALAFVAWSFRGLRPEVA